MKVPGLGFAAALLLMALAPTAAFAVQDSAPSNHPDTEALNRAMNDENPPSAIAADQHDKGKKEAGPFVTAAKVPCTMTDAYYIGGGPGTDKVYADFYEVACKEGLGYVLSVKKKDPAPGVFDCVMMMAKLPTGKPNPLACRLPANRHPTLGLQAAVTQAGHTCTVSKGRFVGATKDVDIYEVGCGEGGGYILETAPEGSGSTVAPKTTSCLIYGSVAGGITCTLLTDAEQNAYLDKLLAASGKPCPIKARRYVGSIPDGADFYEVACTDNSGYVVQTSASGAFAKLIPCQQASGIGDGCKLTDAREAMTKEAGLYSSLAKKAGFDCDVSKYADFTATDPKMEAVELACSNRPDGGVGFFPTAGGQHGQVLDCLRSEAEGYKCSFTQVTPLYAKLTAELRAKNKNLCVVNNAAQMGSAPAPGGVGKDDYVEVGCADGGPGFVLHYTYGQPQPIELLNCAQAAQLGAGGCKLSKG
jgi:hypothetical protein